MLDAVAEALPLGTSFGAPTEREVRFAEAVIDAFPSVERLRMTSSGSEAVMGALRLARAATGRDPIVKVAGGYHGAIDGLLAEAGSGLATFGVPSSPGVTAAATSATRIVPYNDPAAARTALDGAAAMLVEPVAGNMGVVPPDEGYLAALRAACDEAGALLVLDEVITGFRVARGGAQERYGVRADLTCFGKVIGGGLPVGAFGGRADVMAELAPEGPCYQAGTLSGNPLATAAGLAVLAELAREGVYARLEEGGAALEDALGASGAPVTVEPGRLHAHALLRRRPGGRLRDRDAERHGRLRRLRARPARGRRLPAAVAVRGLVRGARPRRGRAGPGARGLRARRRGPVRAVLAQEAALAAELVEPAAEPLLAPLVAPPLTPDQAAGLDLILEGFLLHHGRPRHLSPSEPGREVLAGDYCYAHGLVRIADSGDLVVIEALADLIALGAGVVASGRREALEPLWRATAAAIAARGAADADDVAARLTEAKRRLRADGDPSGLAEVAAGLPPTPGLAEGLAG